MPNTTTYNAEYFRTHKVTIGRQRQAAQSIASLDPHITARGPWLAALLVRHALSKHLLAHLLALSPRTVYCWFAPPGTRGWMPIPDERVPHIRTLLPADAPMAPAVLALLPWPEVQRAAYVVYWGQDIHLTAAELHAWRTVRYRTRGQLAHWRKAWAARLGIHAQTIRHYERGTLAMTRVQQKNLRWLMEEEGKEIS